MEVKLTIPALERLIALTASGVGAVAGPMLARRAARARADTLRIEAEGKADAIKLIASAQQEAISYLSETSTSIGTEMDISKEIEARVSFQEEKRQRNMEAVVRTAADHLGDKEVNNSEINHDWTAAFFSSVQDISSEGMQQIWARILAGEVEHPGTVSIRTLFILRTMSQADAESFHRVTPYVICSVIFTEQHIIEPIKEFPNYAHFMKLSELGLINIASGLRMMWEGEKIGIIGGTNKLYQFVHKKQDAIDISPSVYILTSAGEELYNTIGMEPDRNYLKSVSFFFSLHDVSIAITDLARANEVDSTIFDPWLDLEQD